MSLLQMEIPVDNLQVDLKPDEYSGTFTDWGIYQHLGPNRSGKTMGMVIDAWKAYRRGVDVYCNCSENPFTNEVEHILNFPHIDYQPGELLNMGLRNVFVMTDQAEQFMDATAATKAVRQIGNFGYQAKKRSIAWHHDSVRAMNLYNRIRKNPDWIIYSKRYPHNWHLPLKAIRLEFTTDQNGDGNVQSRKRLIVNPERFFPLYNDVAMVRTD